MIERRDRARVDDLMPQVLSDLTDLARIPSVSLPSFDAAHVAASADRVAELLRGAGAQVEVVRAGDGHPAVIGRVPGPPGAPTVLLYAHHDVQPPGRDEDWTSTPDGPFEPVEPEPAGANDDNDVFSVAPSLPAPEIAPVPSRLTMNGKE